MTAYHPDPEIDKVLAKKAERKAKPGGGIKPKTLVYNLLHQSFFYLDKTERRMRVFFEIGPAALLYAGLSPLLKTREEIIGAAVLSLIAVHFLNWVFNNNFWNCINNTFPSMQNRGAESTRNYVNNLAARLRKRNSISAVMLIGSISRFEWHMRSDIDLRILRLPGFFNGFAAAFLVLRERAIAVFLRQPLDVYLADSPTFLAKIRKDETPIFLLKRDPRLSAARFEGKEVEELPPLVQTSPKIS